jgi:hypothetical protein
MEVATEHQGKGDHAKAKEYWQKDQEHSRPADEHSNMAACQACHCNDAFEAGLPERACNPIAISDAPPTIMSIPIKLSKKRFLFFAPGETATAAFLARLRIERRVLFAAQCLAGELDEMVGNEADAKYGLDLAPSQSIVDGAP